MTISKQHQSIYEVLIHQLEHFIEAPDIFIIGHLLIIFVSPIQLTNILDQVKTAYRKEAQTTLFCFLICTITMT